MPIRILVCDDHEMLRQGMKDFLTKFFTQAVVGEAGNAHQALELFSKEKWHLVLLDIQLPGKDGLRLLPELKAIQPQVPVLIFSGLSEEEFAVRSLKLGAAGFIGKGGKTSELFAAIQKALAGQRYISPGVAEQIASHVIDAGEDAPHNKLSDREFQVMLSLAHGQAVKEIADRLSLSAKTVSTYRARVCSKLSLQSDAEIARYAIRYGLID